MLEVISTTNLDALPMIRRNAILEELQGFLVEKVRDFHAQKRLEIVYDPTKTTRRMIQEVLRVARETGKGGAVAQYLIGAKLQLRFPELTISNESYSTADAQRGRRGDFLVGNTVFHVTLAPMPAVFEKCQRNLEEGLRAFLLVPDEIAIGARQTAELTAEGRITVEAIESFVAQNVEEISGFASENLLAEFRRLLEIYNERVAVVEIDRSMMIDIPQNLL